MVAQTLDMPYVSSGDIARSMAIQDRCVGAALNRGEMAPEDAMRQEIYRVLYKLYFNDRGFVLDGFPRFDEQYLWLMKRFPSLMYYVINTDISVCKHRTMYRGRPDDNGSSFDRRMEYYDTYTRPMISMIGLVLKVGNNQDNGAYVSAKTIAHDYDTRSRG
jgi:adenylate kinase family enzyme